MSASPVLLRRLLLVSTLCAGVAGGAAAADFNVKLSGDNEVPPVKSAGSGSGTITVADDGSVSGHISVTGFTPTMAHIHVGAVGEIGGVVVPMKAAGDGFDVPPGARLNQQQLADLKAGKLYVNVHSADNKKGEIRAQLQ